MKRSWIKFTSLEKFNPCGSKSTSETSVIHFTMNVWDFTAVASFFTFKACSLSELLWVDGAILTWIVFDSTTEGPSGWTVPDNCLNPSRPFIETITGSILASECCFEFSSVIWICNWEPFVLKACTGTIQKLWFPQNSSNWKLYLNS